DDELPAAALKGFQVWVGGVESVRQFVIGELYVAIEVERPVVPRGVFENCVGEARSGESILQALARGRAGDPRAPPSTARLAARKKSGIDLHAFGIARASIDLPESRHLRRGETTGGFGA